MEKYELNGEVYYYTGKNWIDSHYTVVKRDVLSSLNALRSSDMFMGDKTFEELLKEADQVKDTDDYIMAIKIYERMLELTDDANEIRKIMPRYTSMLRKESKPKKAIEKFNYFYEQYGKQISSPALYTSVAAAYCDISNVETARQFANKARALSAGNSSPELISVYSRIKKLESVW